MRALVCDDDASSRFVLKRLLTQHLGCTVVECADGVEALARLDEGGVELLILDIQMPGMDGVEVLAAIRATATFKHLPVVAVSNERHEDVVRRLLEMGISGYALKPIRAEKLTSILDRLRSRLSQGRPVTAGTTAARVCLGPDSPAMIADGSLDYRHFFMSYAERFGPVIEASSGAGALTAWRAAQAPLVFVGSDLGILGVERLVPKLRAMAGPQPLRLVRLLEGDIRQGDAGGCDDVMRRSFVPEEFRQAFLAFVQRPAPLDAVTRLVGDPQALVMSAAKQVFGMMLDSELTLLSEAPDEGPHVGAMSTISFAHEHALALKLFASPRALAEVASRMLSVPATEVTGDAATAAAGELVNLITGRLQAAMDERRVPAECALASLAPPGTTWVEPDVETRGILQHVQVVGTSATLHLALEAA